MLARAADAIAEYSKATATGEALCEMGNDLRSEIIRQTHRVEMLTRHIEMLTTEYERVQDRLLSPLPPVAEVDADLE